ncbi:alpha/beta hydrolase [Lentzea fradiae]|nr:alpha/beta hydrolase [Lentzea fradiae]
MTRALLAVVVLLLGTATAAAEPVRPVSIAWGPCPEDAEGECGAFSVPLDWDEPRGPRIDLAVTRHRATDPARRAGVLLVDPGGPGGSAAQFALSRYFSEDLRARFDIVGVDSRGTGGSLAIRCADLLSGAPSSHPADEAGFEALLRFNRTANSRCRERSGPIFDNAHSDLVARDVDALRQALGERKISYYGISYGTMFGQLYAERYGHRVRAMVLDSVVDHSADLTRFVGDRAAAADDSFVEFARWCDRTASCPLHGQDVFAAWEAALDRAGEGRQELLDLMYLALRDPAWPWAAELVAATPAARALAFEPNYESVMRATVCQDFSLRVKNFQQYSRLRAEELRRSPLMRGNFVGHNEVMACTGIPGPPANPPHRLDISGAPTVLVLSARHDPTTPYAWAVNIKRQSPHNTALLTYEGWGHGAYLRSACTRGGVDSYLLDLTVPASSCPAVE